MSSDILSEKLSQRGKKKLLVTMEALKKYISSFSFTRLSLAIYLFSLLLVPVHLGEPQEMAESTRVPEQEADAGQWSGCPALLCRRYSF